MTKSHSPAKQATLLVVLAVAGLVTLLFVALVELAGYLGVALFVVLLAVLIALAAIAGVSLEVTFELFAYAVGFVRSAVARMSARLRR